MNKITSLLLFFLVFSTPHNSFAQPSLLNGPVANSNFYLPDFQVNENGGQNYPYKSAPVISSDCMGNFVIVWEDHRNQESGIYAQRFSSDGRPAGANFKISDNIIPFIIEPNPAVSMDSYGNFVISWVGYDGNYDSKLFVQLYSKNGSKSGEISTVDKWLDSSFVYASAVSTDSAGNFVITWFEGINGEENRNILGQRYSNEGKAMGSIFRVNADSISPYYSPPAISSAPNGDFVIVWVNNYHGNFRIYGQQFSHDGIPKGDNFRVTQDSGFTIKEELSISSDKDGNFVIVWVDDRDRDVVYPYYDIYAQRYSNDGSPLGTNFKINQNIREVNRYYPSVSCTREGNFIVSWGENREGNYDIYARRFSRDGTGLGSEIKVNDNSDSTNQFGSSITVDCNGNFTLAWGSFENNVSGIYAKQFSPDGQKKGSSFRVNDDTGEAYSNQGVSTIAVNKDGNFILAWEDERNGEYDIYAQLMSNQGEFSGTNFMVNDFPGHQNLAPFVFFLSNGGFVITWIAARRNDQIFARIYKEDGSPLGTSFQVNDPRVSDNIGESHAAADSNGNFVIVWSEHWNTTPQKSGVFAQRFSIDAKPLGANFRVNDDFESSQGSPAVACTEEGKFLITWMDYRFAKSQIVGQLFTTEGDKEGPSFLIFDNPGIGPAISSNSAGNFVVTCAVYSYDSMDIYGQRLHSDGSKLGTTFKVNDRNSKAEPYYNGSRYPSTALDNSGNFIITWIDSRNGDMEIYGQRYLSDGRPFGNNFRITESSKGNQTQPDVQMWNNMIYNSWTDDRVGDKDNDIWANNFEWDDLSAIITPREFLPSGYILEQNFPNPFNPATIIRYKIPNISVRTGIDPKIKGMNGLEAGRYLSLHPIHVKLSVYDILGNEIVTLVNKIQNPGNYEVSFDAGGLPSGVYFCTLHAAEFSETKKMVLLR